MLWHLIQDRAVKWSNQSDCPARFLLDYMRVQGRLRDAQIGALTVYLFLKLAGQNKPLWQLISEGFLVKDDDLNQLAISHNLRTALHANLALKGLFDLARFQVGNGAMLYEALYQHLIEHPDTDALAIIKKLFYGVGYTDYLLSLPMGAGKTYLMASIIYLDLYFAQNEPNNPLFAHNFLLLIPSGLKSSIGPSLKSIARFDPTWVIPEPSASQLKSLLKFEVLDESSSAKKSNTARNPNAQKVNAHQPFESQQGLVFVVNAEKVILDRVELDAQLELVERSDDDKDRQANELRHLIGKLPNLQILIDEVHHAANDEIKLRQVVNRWNVNGTINSVLGFTGTPYLAKTETIQLTDSLSVKSTFIANTLYYYPLVKAIQGFLKKPRVERVKGLSSDALVQQGVSDFMTSFGNKRYANGACAKLAIYCGSIERLETQIYPLLLSMGIPADVILKYHKGNSTYKVSKEAELAFAALDMPHSAIQIVLLVQVGKEGWDCRSLTGVLLSQKGDCPNTMTLQTACRCLRQMDGGYEPALIWLNEDNAKTLDKQLKEEQHTSIEEINQLAKQTVSERIQQVSRLDTLALPRLHFYKMQLKTSEVVVDTRTPEAKMNAIHAQAQAVIKTTGSLGEVTSTQLIDVVKGEAITFSDWLLRIAKGSFGRLSVQHLRAFESQLQAIFDQVTLTEGECIYVNKVYHLEQIEASIRLAFYQHKTIKTDFELVPDNAKLCVVEKLKSLPISDKLYPDKGQCENILHNDQTGVVASNDYELAKAALEAQREQFAALGIQLPALDEASFKQQNLAVASAKRSFHYLPYNFSQSGFEKTFMQHALSLAQVQQQGLEVYYNGDRALTDFSIECFESNGKLGWKKVGKYTPDFLIVQRDASKQAIVKALIVETKGEGFAAQDAFIKRKTFVENWFVPQHQQATGHFPAFDYVFIRDDEPEANFLSKLQHKITQFFSEV
jgi:superfamily II DNA or RNA helicase